MGAKEGLLERALNIREGLFCTECRRCIRLCWAVIGGNDISEHGMGFFKIQFLVAEVVVIYLLW